jgi:alpha-glucosidase (family GH31 glycosyl hydrolase)
MQIDLLPGEYWWGGAVVDGYRMPFAPGFQRDLQSLGGNQAMPLLLSSKGRYLWSEQPFRYALSDTLLLVEGSGPFQLVDGFSDLQGAFRAASQAHFPASGKLPDPLAFGMPQYNLWIELLYAPTQAKVLAYAQALLAHGFPPGVLMIDTLWHECYGDWRFHSGRFPQPQAMVRELHAMGFKVMLWVCPWVSPDSLIFRQLRAKGLLINRPDGKPALGEWWDGYSAVLNVRDPLAVTWLHEQLDRLVETVGIDGFKFDGGQAEFFASLAVEQPHSYCTAWNALGLRYSLSELKDSWRSAGWPLMQRIRDRHHSWDAQHGLRSLIPLGLAQGLLGYPFICPDMVGGGEYKAFPPTAENQHFLVETNSASQQFDPELFVRSAQSAALFPMMQFSAAPWRLLTGEHLAACRAAALLHVQFGPEILALAQQSARTGEPLLRHMAYVFPHCGYEQLSNQFLLGDTLLVAPVLEAGAITRTVVIPPGTWLGDDGNLVVGPTVITAVAPLTRLPYYRRQVLRV